MAKQEFEVLKKALATQVDVTEAQTKLKKHAQTAKLTLTRDLKK